MNFVTENKKKIENITIKYSAENLNALVQEVSCCNTLDGSHEGEAEYTANYFTAHITKQSISIVLQQ